MKRKKILALALAITTAFTTLAPNTGFVPAMVVRAEGENTNTPVEHYLTYYAGGDVNFTEPVAPEELANGNSNQKLSDKAEADGYVLQGWEIGGKTYEPGELYPYTATEYKNGVVATAKWKEAIVIAAGENNGEWKPDDETLFTKGYDGTKDWSKTLEVNPAVHDTEKVKVKFTGHYDQNDYTASKVVIDSIEIVNAADAAKYELDVKSAVKAETGFHGVILRNAGITLDTSKLTGFVYDGGGYGNEINAAVKVSDSNNITFDGTEEGAFTLLYAVPDAESEDGYAPIDDEAGDGPEDAGTYTIFVEAEENWNENYAVPTEPLGTVTIAQKDISNASSGITISGLVTKQYTGSKVTEDELVITDSKRFAGYDDTTKERKNTEPVELNLVENKIGDYTVKYSDNVNVSTKAKVTITGSGNYKGTKTANFEIARTKTSFAGVLTVGNEGEIAYGVTPAPTGLTVNNSSDEEIKGVTIKYLYQKHGTTTWKTADEIGKFTVNADGEEWKVKAVVEDTTSYAGCESDPEEFSVIPATKSGVLSYGGILPTSNTLSIDLSSTIEGLGLDDSINLEGLEKVDEFNEETEVGIKLGDETIFGENDTLAFKGNKLNITFEDGHFTDGAWKEENNSDEIIEIRQNTANYGVVLTVTMKLYKKDTKVVSPELTVTGGTYGDKVLETHSVKLNGTPITKNLTFKYSVDGIEFAELSEFNEAIEAIEDETEKAFYKANPLAYLVDDESGGAHTYYLKAEYEDEEGGFVGEVTESFEIAPLTVTITAKDTTFDNSAENANFDLVEFVATQSVDKYADGRTARDFASDEDLFIVEPDENLDITKNGKYDILVTPSNDLLTMLDDPSFPFTFTYKNGTLTISGNKDDEEQPIDAEAALAEAKALIAAAEALPDTKDAVTNVDEAKAAIANVEALDKALTAEERAVIEDEAVKTALGKVADQVAAAKAAVAEKEAEKQDDEKQDDQKQDDQKQDDQKQDDQKQDDQSGAGTTTGSSTDVTPSGSGSGGSGGGGGSSNAKTVKNADGSTTTTTTTAKGTIETTTKTNADGSKTTSKVVKNKDGSGSVTETSVSAAGTTKVVEVVTDTTGAATEVTTTVSNSKGASMKVTYAAKGTAITVSKVETTGKTAVSIPATVKVGGKTYKVTKIAASALKGNKEITKVTLGANVKSIGKNAFNGDSKLKTIVMKKAPTTVGKNAFKDIAKKATIKIKATKKAFKTAKKLIKKSGIASTVKIKRTK